MLAALVLALSPFSGTLPASGSPAPAPVPVPVPAPSDDEASEPTGDEEPPPPQDELESGPEIPEEDLIKAGDAFNRGVEAFKEERYEDALRHFSRAQELAPHPDTLYNLGLTQQLVGKHLEAWRSFDELLAQAHDDKERQDLLAMQAQSRAYVARLRVRVDPVQPVCFDGAPMPREHGELSVLTTPGEHALDLDRQHRALVHEGGETRMLDLELREPKPPAPPRRRLRVLAGFAIGGTTVASGLGLGAGLAPERGLRLGLGVSAAAAGAVALTTTIIALVTHRRMRQWTPPPPQPPCSAAP